MNNATPPVASVNGIALHHPDEMLDAAELRQRACTELLRQVAIAQGLLGADDPAPVGGSTSAAASRAIEQLLDRTLELPEPTEEACRRYYGANRARLAVGERVHVRHILFAVTPGVNVNALRSRAEACLLDVRCTDPDQADRFTRAALEWSNCPSGTTGGDLGWLGRDECAPEFATQIFGQTEIGVLSRLVHSRFGFHVVEVMARAPGVVPEFEATQTTVTQKLRQQAFATALRQYVTVEASRAHIIGVDLDVAQTPLVQ